MVHSVNELVKSWWENGGYSGSLDFKYSDDKVMYTLYTSNNRYKTLLTKDRIHCVAERRDNDAPRPKTIVDVSFDENGWHKLMQSIAQNECIVTVPADVESDHLTESDMTSQVLSDNSMLCKSQLIFDFMV